MRAAGQPDCSGEVGQGGDLAACGGVAGIHGVAAGHHGDQAARPHQVQALDDEVVVDAVPAGVVPPVGQGEIAERDVADRQVEAAFGGTGVGERLVGDIGIGVQHRRDRGGDWVQLHARDPGAAGREADEVPAAASCFQDAALGEAELLHPCPDGLDEGGVGVVRVEGVAGGGRQLPRCRQPGQFLACPGKLRLAVVEDLRDRAPPGPAGQDRLLLGQGRAVVPFDGAQRGERREVRADAGDGTGRGQVVLAPGPEPRGGG